MCASIKFISMLNLNANYNFTLDICHSTATTLTLKAQTQIHRNRIQDYLNSCEMVKL